MATSLTRIASQTLEIDGSRIAPINGPYGGVYYSCQIGKCQVGAHSYRITATDLVGASYICTGTFTVVAPAPPTIASVVVAEAGATKNGVLESTDPLKITWSATSQYGIATQIMMIDGTKITPINGPYGGQYYSCPIGTWPAGSHTYTITATDSLGDSSTSTGTIMIAAPGSLSLVDGGTGTLTLGGVLQTTTVGMTTVETGTLTLGGGTMRVTGDTTNTNGSITTGSVVYTGSTTNTTVSLNVNVGTLTIDRGIFNPGTLTVIPVDGSSLTLTGATSVIQLNGTLCLNTLNNVAVVEGGASTNGIPESNEELAVTWNVPNINAATSQAVTVDGQSFTAIVGDGSGSYRCNIGGWAPGQHTFTIRIDHGAGSEIYTAAFSVATPLTVDASPAAPASADLLSDAQLAPIVAAAEARWSAPGSSQVASAMANIDFKVANLAPGVLAERWQNTIWIDDDAAGYGWFVDPTPGDDTEFASVAGTSSLAAPADTVAAQRADLLTAVMHEIGNVLGNSDTSADDLMNAMLPLGTRRIPGAPV